MINLERFYDMVKAGYLNSQTQGDLVLFNYNEKCTYDKFWTEVTLQARGIIFNKVTGECVARPFPKFFNLSEHENKNLPAVPYTESYEVYEKLDGSLGILYKDADGTYKIATRGSFTSPQALKATEMFNKNLVDYVITSARHWDTFSMSRDYTLLFEIIYPENRVSFGARLVVDYGSNEMLVLLGAINKRTGQDMDYGRLQYVGHLLNLPVAKKYNYTLSQLNEMRKTLPATEEGWVIRFDSGFRVKVKGDEYIKMHRIINSINPLSIWQRMVDENSMKISDEYKQTLPEEILPELETIESKLCDRYGSVLTQIGQDYIRFQDMLYLVESTTEGPVNPKKVLGLFCQDFRFNVKHPSAMFMYQSGNMEGLRKIILKIIRPNGNIIE